MMDDRLWYLPLIITLILLGAALFYQVPSTKWKTAKLADNPDSRFLDMQVTSDNIYVYYRRSTSGGLKVKTTQRPKGVMSIFQGLNWDTATIDDEPGSGAMIESAMINGRPAVVYQDSSVGSEKVVYAVRDNGNWTKKVIGDVRRDGANVGEYTALSSFKGQPVALFHSPVEGLVARTGSDLGNKKILGKGEGWLLDADSCGDRAEAAYIGRKNRDIKVASFDGSWTTKSLGIEGFSSLAIDLSGCRRHLLYLDPNETVRYIGPDGNTDVLATKSDRTGLSLDVKDKVHAVYYNYGDGLYYAEREDGKWTKKELGNWRDTSLFNSLGVDDSGNVFVTYVHDSDLVMTYHSTDRENALRTILTVSRIILLVLILAFIAQIYRKTHFREIKALYSMARTELDGLKA